MKNKFSIWNGTVSKRCTKDIEDSFVKLKNNFVNAIP